MMKAHRLLLASLAFLASPIPGPGNVVLQVAAQEHNFEGRFVGANKGLRHLKNHRRHHNHHKAIQDDWTEVVEHLAYDDDIEPTYEDHEHVDSYYDIHIPEFLDESITPRPFQNCIPESFHENNKHGGGHHHHKHKHGGMNHHHKKHKGALKGYDGQNDGDYYSKGSKGKGKGKGGYTKSAKSKSTKGGKGGKGKGGKSKGAYYYRQRFLGRRYRRNGGANGTRKGGHVMHQGNRGGQGRMGSHYHEHHQYNATHQLEHDDEFDAEQKQKNGQSHHPHPHTHDAGGLPLCPNVAPKRRTFAPVPTISPQESPISGDNGISAPTVATSGAEPMQDAGTPVDTPAGTDRILVESNLAFDFFDTVTPSAPSMADIDNMLARASEWYTTQLQMTFPNLESFEAAFVNSLIDLEGTDPIRVDFDANAFFTSGTEVPSTQDVFIAMQDLDYQDFITSAVWTDDRSAGPFDDIQRAGYSARVSSGR